MQEKRKKRKWGLWVILSLTGLCMGLLGISALVNIFIPRATENVDSINSLDMTYTLETQHLREELGKQVFPGFQALDIPILLFNEEHAFLVGIPYPQTGWVKVPQEEARGSDWVEMPVLQSYPNLAYFRTGYSSDEGPDAFTLRVGDTYVASLPTHDWFRISLMNQFRDELPGFLKPIFPYSLVASIFMPNSDTYLSLIQHESFHAFQANWAPDRFNQAEWDGIRLADQYPWEDQTVIDNWQVELDLLQSALKNNNHDEMVALAQQFIEQRDTRRKLTRLSTALIRYENQREWVEGMARYTELESWRLAGSTTGYQPEDELQNDHKFKDYQTFSSRWNRELEQMTRMASDEGDGRFYYSGMAQAFLLDQLEPTWKQTLFADPSLNLEDLLRRALAK
jgi:hypothetical protein